MTIQTIETVKKDILEHNFKKEQTEKKQEILEELEKTKRIFLLKKFKKHNGVKSSNKLRNNLEKILLKKMWTYAQEKNLSTSLKKKIISSGIEILNNISCYSVSKKPLIFQIVEWIDNTNKKVYKIQSRNYYMDPTGEKTAKLEAKLNNVNTSTKEKIKEQKNKILLDGDEDHKNNWLSEFGNAGLGYLEIGRIVKEINNSPFTYEFTRQKDGTVKFDLTITIPEEKKEEKIK